MSVCLTDNFNCMPIVIVIVITKVSVDINEIDQIQS